MIRRINLCGGPGCGKSASAGRLYGELKAQRHNVEMIPEYVKTWAYAGRHPEGFDQVYIFSKQLYAESTALKHVDRVVCESPLWLAVAYGKRYDAHGWQHLIGLAVEFERHNRSLNVMLDRGDIPYVQHGRYQDYAAAVEMDDAIRSIMDDCGVSYVTVRSGDVAALVDAVTAGLAS